MTLEFQWSGPLDEESSDLGIAIADENSTIKDAEVALDRWHDEHCSCGKRGQCSACSIHSAVWEFGTFF
jgi:hypothetical protein